MPARTPPPSKPPKHFTPFRSAAEENEMKVVEHSWNDEAGHLSSLSGVVVSTPGNALPYKAILRRISERYTEHSFPTMREAEAFVRRSTPVPPARRTLHDRDASSLNSKGD